MSNDDTYDILYSKSIRELKKRIEDKKIKGWKCAGGVEIHNIKKGEYWETFFYQAMEKEIEND